MLKRISLEEENKMKVTLDVSTNRQLSSIHNNINIDCQCYVFL